MVVMRAFYAELGATLGLIPLPALNAPLEAIALQDQKSQFLVMRVATPLLRRNLAQAAPKESFRAKQVRPAVMLVP